MQADARTPPPSVLHEYAPGGGGVGSRDGGGRASKRSEKRCGQPEPSGGRGGMEGVGNSEAQTRGYGGGVGSTMNPRGGGMAGVWAAAKQLGAAGAQAAVHHFLRPRVLHARGASSRRLSVPPPVPEPPWNPTVCRWMPSHSAPAAAAVRWPSALHRVSGWMSPLPTRCS
jgi:hypothetical protein